MGPQGIPGPGWPVGSVIYLVPGAAPPQGFTLLGTFRAFKEGDRVKPKKDGDDHKNDHDQDDAVIVSVYVKM
jgi:hypothetical protein